MALKVQNILFLVDSNELLSEDDNGSKYDDKQTKLLDDECSFINEDEILLNLNEDEYLNSRGILQCIKCCCHTMELAIHDVLQNNDINGILEMSNEMVVHLRTPIIYSIEKEKYRKPITFCRTRWHNIFETLNSLLDLKIFCSKYESIDIRLHMSDDQWRNVLLLKNALYHLKIAIKKLQSDQLLLSDFYRIWFNCLLSLKADNNKYSKTLYVFMDCRSREILHKPIVLAAVFLDARYQILLNTT